MYSVKVESNFISNQPQRREKALEGHALHIPPFTFVPAIFPLYVLWCQNPCVFLGAPRAAPGGPGLVGKEPEGKEQGPWRIALGGHSRRVSEIRCCSVAQSFGNM